MIKSISKFFFSVEMNFESSLTSEAFFAHYKSLPSAIYYDDNKSYRENIRTIFRIKNQKMSPYASLSVSDIYSKDEIDEESLDEMMLDSDALDTYMEYLFILTRNTNDFQDLYKKAAARMFSLDMKIGQAVLCSYDTFKWYHSCVWFYIVDPTTIISSLPEFKKLANHFDTT
jgi:hypothetical protein|tara:strand:+ start:1037 stop:1552 length:516 start_codon:yes stop_codon:yes gene_type:complete